MLALAPDVMVCVSGRELALHGSAGAGQAFRTQRAELVGWLLRFAHPRDPATVLNALAPADRTEAERLITRLKQQGLLVEAASSASKPDREPAARALTQRLAVLARLTYDLAADLRAFGPAAFEFADDIGPEARVLGRLAALSSLRRELASKRAAWLERQIDQLEPRPNPPFDLNLGCGGMILDGWLNLDLYSAPLCWNLQWGLPFSDASVSQIYTAHTLEHLFFPVDAMKLLHERRRVPVPGGVLRVVVPDIERSIAAYVAGDREYLAACCREDGGAVNVATPRAAFLAYAGAGPEPGHLFESHKYGYDFATQERVLREAGFVRARRWRFDASADPALRIDHLGRSASAAHAGEYCSSFVEAHAP